VLEDISFDVGPQELVSIVGPSGVGKTTLLTLIAGLDVPDQGTVHFSVHRQNNIRSLSYFRIMCFSPP
jgi:ABC-type sugar transport system ATPase subunit